LRRVLARVWARVRPPCVPRACPGAGGEPVTRRSFRVRRRWLEALLQAGDRAVAGQGYGGDATLVAEALSTLGIAGLSARQLSSRYRAGPAGAAWLRAPI